MTPSAVPLNARLSALVALGERLDAAEMATAPGEALRAVVPELGLRAGWIFLTDTVLGDVRSGALAHGVNMVTCSRLARELHDALSQPLFATTPQLRLARKEGGDAEPVARAERLLADAQHELRALVEASRSPDLSAGLVPALARPAERMAPSVTVHLDAAPARPTADVAEAVYRVAQEAVHNAVRHGEARRVRIAVKRSTDGALRLSVQDDGHGCDPEVAANGPGLHGAKERIASLGGALHVARGDEEGLRIVVEIPSSAHWTDDRFEEVA